MLRKRLPLSVRRILRVVGLRESLIARVDHQDPALSHSRDYEVPVKPHADHCVLHGSTVEPRADIFAGGVA